MNFWKIASEESPPKDRPFWAATHGKTITLVEFVSAEKTAHELGGMPDGFNDCFCSVSDHSEQWNIKSWVDYFSIPPAPLSA